MTESLTTANRKSNARRVLRDRKRSNLAASRIERRGVGSLASHAMAAGLPLREARTVATGLRRAAGKLCVAGTVGLTYSEHKSRTVARFTKAQVAALVDPEVKGTYRPRKAEYKLVVARLVLRAFGA
jgi:hypothetical protein